MSKPTYSEEFKLAAVKALLLPGPHNLTSTTKKFDISTSSLYLWKMKYGNIDPMKKSKKVSDWTSEQKLETVIKTASMSEEELGEFLRSEGLHSSDLETIKNDLLTPQSSKGRPKLDPEVAELRKQVKDLSKDLKRKESALAEYSARVILLKKSHEIWGTDEEDE